MRGETMTSRRQQRLHPDFYSAPGATALLTMCCRDHRRIFETRGACEIAVSQLHELHGDLWSILCYVVMPDHVHSIVINRSDSLIDFVRLFKGRSAAALRRNIGLKNVWQESFHDRMVRRSDDLGEIIKYVYDNPVRAGFVDSFKEWPGVGSCMWPNLGVSIEGYGFENIRWQDALIDP